jgi:serine/threonine protein kinase
MSLPIFSNYTAIRVLGQGGMATVYLATHNTLGHHVAVKVLIKEYIFNQNIRSRFVEEAKKMVRMNHLNVVKVSDLIDEENTVAIVMEYVEGKTLAELCNKKKLSNQEIELYLKQMLQALSYIHTQGLIHRDIKPSNFILSKDGYLKLTDFGISKSFLIDNEHTQTGTSMSLGTPMYMSPEQVRSAKEVYHLTDIYSLGVVLWQLASGQKPYNSSTTSTFDLQLKIVQEKLPLTNTRWDEIIQKATQKEDTKRFLSATEFLSALDNKGENNQDFDKTLLTENVVLSQGKKSNKTVNQWLSKRKVSIVFFILILFFLLISIVLIINKTEVKVGQENKPSIKEKIYKRNNDSTRENIKVKKLDVISNDSIIKHDFNLKTVNSTKSQYGWDKVISVKKTKKFTIIKIRSLICEKFAWISINPKSYIIDKSNNKKLFISDCYNISFSPLYRCALKNNEITDFELYFPAVSENCTTIDFIEDKSSNWKFYNLKVTKAENESDKKIVEKIRRGKVEAYERRKECERQLQEDEENTLKIGQKYQGGIIYSLDDSGIHGKVCAETDLGEFDWVSAIKRCKNLNLNGYSDWYLPTIDDLVELFLQKHILSNLSEGSYWSSSESVSNKVEVTEFGTFRCYTFEVEKELLLNVRAIRNF